MALDALAKAALETGRDPSAPHLQWLSSVIGGPALATLAVMAERRRASVDTRLAGLGRT